MTSALQQVREKAPDTADAMKRHKAGNAGFTDKAHLKAKGLIPRSDGTKKVSPKYEETCPKCEGEECQCPTTMEITNADKMINTTAYQNYKSGSEGYHPAEDLEEQRRILEEQLKNAEEELEELSSGAGGAAGGYSLPLGEKPSFFHDEIPRLKGTMPGIKLIYKRREKGN